MPHDTFTAKIICTFHLLLTTQGLGHKIHFCNMTNLSFPWKSLCTDLIIIRHSLPVDELFTVSRRCGSKYGWQGSTSKNKQPFGFKATLLSITRSSITCSPSLPPSNARKSSYLEIMIEYDEHEYYRNHETQLIAITISIGFRKYNSFLHITYNVTSGSSPVKSFLKI